MPRPVDRVPCPNGSDRNEQLDGEKIRFVVPTNFDPALPGLIKSLNDTHPRAEVVELYGALPRTIVGHGRSPQGLPQVGPAELAEQVNLAHDSGLLFNYLLNGLCDERQRGNPAWISSLLVELERLVLVGVDSATVSDPWLVSLLRRHFPSLEVKVSLIAGIDTVEAARRYDDLGVAAINLNGHTINRDVGTIRSIVESVSANVQLYANISCLERCPRRDQHYRFVANSSRLGLGLVSSEYRDPFISWCLTQYRADRTALLRTPFIRPQDVPSYAALGVGSFKLSDRKMSTNVLAATVREYLCLVDPPDLFPLLFGNGQAWLEESKHSISKAHLPSISSSVLTSLDFISNVTSLRGSRLREFYGEATELAVQGSRFWSVPSLLTPAAQTTS